MLFPIGHFNIWVKTRQGRINAFHSSNIIFRTFHSND
jgi:hypothetical protein